MLTICTWWWGDKFGIDHVNKLAASVRRNLAQTYRFVCIHDADKGFPDFSDAVTHSWPIIDTELTKTKGCFARLRMFDPEWQEMYPGNTELYGNAPFSRLVSIDLDTIIVGQLDPVVDRKEDFVIMQGGNATNPCPYNGALMLLRPGAHPEVWKDFSLEAAAKVPFYSFPDDQAWLAHKVPGAAAWKTGPEHGVYVFQKPGWPGGGYVPPDGARLVTFINRDPSQLMDLKWVQENWRV